MREEVPASGHHCEHNTLIWLSFVALIKTLVARGRASNMVQIKAIFISASANISAFGHKSAQNTGNDERDLTEK